MRTVSLVLPCLLAATPAAQPAIDTVATFSIVARDPTTGALGVAVQSRVPAVGAVVPFAEAGVGAVATQASANPTYGPDGLKLLREGRSPREAILQLTGADQGRASRQLGIVDAQGRVASFTGQGCNAWAGHKEGVDYCCQGNILADAAVVADMGRAFEESLGLPLPERLLLALEAAQKAGGDRRGMQSAAMFVVRKGAGYGGLSDRFVDLRVDDHQQPIEELRRLYGIWGRGPFQWNVPRLVRQEREQKQQEALLADLHLLLRSGRLRPDVVTDDERKALDQHLSALQEKASEAVKAELAKDRERLAARRETPAAAGR
jgi:uncharacterized Ntn-hydrolase superfamily protein